jgi:hypothetical protein
MWCENGTNVTQMARMKEESVKCKVTVEKKKVELSLGKKCAKIAQILTQKIEINSFDFSNPKVQISAHNESIMSQNMSHKGEINL